MGLPYPNLHAVDMKLRMKYFDQEAKNSKDCRFNGQEYYSSLCMKVVNQSVGRSVRHKDDFAAVILVDKRFKQDKVISNMPDWITKHKQTHDCLTTLVNQVRQFFQKMKAKHEQPKSN